MFSVSGAHLIIIRFPAGGTDRYLVAKRNNRAFCLSVVIKHGLFFALVPVHSPPLLEGEWLLNVATCELFGFGMSAGRAGLC